MTILGLPAGGSSLSLVAEISLCLVSSWSVEVGVDILTTVCLVCIQECEVCDTLWGFGKTVLHGCGLIEMSLQNPPHGVTYDATKVGIFLAP